jgi:hypothetical protein
MIEEQRDKDMQKFAAHQQIIKLCFDNHINANKKFEIEEFVLKWGRANEPKGKHTQFQHLWLGHYKIVEKIGTCT